MLSSMMVYSSSTQHRVTFTFTTGIQIQVYMISVPSRRASFSMHDLKLGVSLGAIHNSSERYPAPNCHTDTRHTIRQIILDWIRNESSASSFFTDLLVPVRQRSFRQLQSLYAGHPDPVKILRATFSFLEESNCKGAIKAIFCSQRSHINSL